MNEIWLIESGWHATQMAKAAKAYSHSVDFLKQESNDDRVRSYFKQFNRLKDPMYMAAEGVGVIEVVGPLMSGAAPVDKWLGATDYKDIMRDIKAASNDPAVKAIVLDVDSGGGMALGAPEIADAIAELAQTKPVVTHTSTIMASAAYYVSAGATAVVASRSAIVGSIGTVAQVVDITAMLERFGVKIETFTPDQSDLKTASYPTVKMTDAQRAWIKESVTATNEDFMSFVTGQRPGVGSSAMRGQVFSGSRAEAAGLVDALGSFEEAITLAGKLAGQG